MINKVTDEQLLRQYHTGDTLSCERLMDRYKGLVLHHAKSLFLVGGELDDLIQEGMIGLFQAVQSYQEDRGASFYTFADLCVRRQMIRAIEAQNTRQNYPLNSAVSLDQENGGSSDAITPPLDASYQDPLDILLGEESLSRMNHRIRKRLSSLETQVLELYLNGADYREIAAELNRSPKSIDNTIQRIRRKIRDEISESGKKSALNTQEVTDHDIPR